MTEKTYRCPDYPREELTRACECDRCMGACSTGECGECFACEERADDRRWWAINRADILGT